MTESGTAPDGAPVVEVGPGRAFETIAAAVAAADEGAVVRVAPGVYTDPVRLDRSLWVVGEEGPDAVRLDVAGGPALLAAAPRGMVRGLTISSAGESVRDVLVTDGLLELDDCVLRAPEPPAGFVVGIEVNGGSASYYPTAAAVLRNCRIHGCGIGVQVSLGGSLTMSSCRVVATDHVGALVGGELVATETVIAGRQGHGIHAAGEGRVRLERSEVSSEQASAVAVLDSATLIASGSRLTCPPPRPRPAADPDIVYPMGHAARRTPWGYDFIDESARDEPPRSAPLLVSAGGRMSLDGCRVDGGDIPVDHREAEGRDQVAVEDTTWNDAPWPATS